LECIYADDIRAYEMTMRIADKYYSKTSENRIAYDENQTEVRRIAIAQIATGTVEYRDPDQERGTKKPNLFLDPWE